MKEYSARTAKAMRRAAMLTPVRFSATAKPFGVLREANGTIHYPFEAAMALPVFDRVALIPVALERGFGVAMEDYAWIVYLTKYLPALGRAESIDGVKAVMDGDEEKNRKEGEPKQNYYAIVAGAGYVDCIKKLMDPAWRAEGLRWLNTVIPEKIVRDKDGNIISYTPPSLNRDHCMDWHPGGGGCREGPGELH